MSCSYDDTSLAPEETTDSFWEVGNYKRTVKRIDDGHRLCNDLMSCVQERAKIEKAYAQQLTDWAKRWRQLIEKGPQYGSLERAWGAIMTEADKVSELHQEVKNSLLNEDLEKVKNWQKDAYHKQIMGGFKETKEAEDGFRKAQKPWAKKMKETQEKYEKVLDDVGKSTPQYMEGMEQVFEQCQQFEEKRLVFLKEVLLDVKRHLNLAENSSRELEQAIRGADAQEDLRWFRSTSGPGMPMNWPQFEVRTVGVGKGVPQKPARASGYSPHTDCALRPPGVEPRSAPHRRQEGEAAQEGGGGGAEQAPAVPPALGAPGLGRSRRVFLPHLSVSSYDRGQPYATEWSDDESGNPFGGNEANGGANPFEDDAKGVRVRALYDYDGQEQDELSFKAGDELTKLGEEDEQGWCRGRLDSGQLGLYPANYVERGAGFGGLTGRVRGGRPASLLSVPSSLPVFPSQETSSPSWAKRTSRAGAAGGWTAGSWASTPPTTWYVERPTAALLSHASPSLVIEFQTYFPIKLLFF
ncbi:Protein kinase C and casein kinase substrate in neurons protein 1 [Fukomys damarensis]|uniref:Protein kinase C and casein kinase substrate in neurons protein 1 n=1 Tax=Fukomys damarensis TaxID=885580 RepID=A0A091DK33_FUKDA|nr:Protein kinase C and casein kinase substrate in neurons protein 1 [Fukomys damarensis]